MITEVTVSNGKKIAPAGTWSVLVTGTRITVQDCRVECNTSQLWTGASKEECDTYAATLTPATIGQQMLALFGAFPADVQASYALLVTPITIMNEAGRYDLSKATILQIEVPEANQPYKDQILALFP